MKYVRTLGLAATMVLGTVTIAGAQTPTLLEQFSRWSTYTYTNGEEKVCYAITQPTKSEPAGVKRDPVYLFITNRPKQSVQREVSVETGYPYKEGSVTEAKVGSDTFTLFTKEQSAWVQNSADESRLIAAMRAGSDMVVTGTSRRGTVTVDTYSLSGVTAAINRIDAECK
ncbi:invasion associated locus B family protein [Chthonobacter albigriseus]|uniref:invasion associated locus B family protein n=1 Tax=Chthonobacter albigriseus TaxID=1683161 RepID=UPI0015EFB26E|nr:invasion associated locus B family protein [Chthonobacter albigriseus]